VVRLALNRSPRRKVDAAADYYTRVFGLRRLWVDAGEGQPTSIGLGMPETDTEIVVHDDPAVPGPLNVHYLVDDVVASCAEFVRQGCSVRVEPFDIAIGKCAAVGDPFGVEFCILDMSKGPRPT
jgi:predicted enzyme related to lactoylglutathione lyase